MNTFFKLFLGIITLFFGIVSAYLFIKVFSSYNLTIAPVNQEEFLYHIVLLGEEDNHYYWNAIEMGATDAANMILRC